MNPPWGGADGPAKTARAVSVADTTLAGGAESSAAEYQAT